MLQFVTALYSFVHSILAHILSFLSCYHMQLLTDLDECMQAVPTKSNPALQYLNSHKAARLGLYGAAVFLAGTLLVAAYRVFQKYNAPQNKRKRNVSKNKVWPFWCTHGMMCFAQPLAQAEVMRLL